MTNLKINLHIIDNCNYSCRHCFAKFGSTAILPLDKWKIIIDNCIENSEVTEFNIAGGEPMIHPNLMEIVKYIVSKGKRCSLITNGILMTEKWVEENAKYFCMIGFSIDSFDPTLMDLIGRTTRNGKKLTIDKFNTLTSLIKSHNPECIVKVNTVVTSLNYQDDIASDLTKLNVDKWKILKMRVFKNATFDNSDIEITKDEFNTFCQINTQTQPQNSFMSEKIKLNNINVVIEKETESAYILIDSNGNLLDNSNTTSYKSLGSCITFKFNQLLPKLNLDQNLYLSRYDQVA